MKGISYPDVCKVIAGVTIGLFGLIASGCDKRPKNVLSDKEMVEVIADLKLAEAYANSQIHGSGTADKREELAKSVLASHGVTQEELDSTLGWYGRNLDKYSELYEKVDKRLLEKKKKLLKDGEETIVETEGDNLWAYEKNGVISTLGNSDGWIISIPDPGLEKGDRIEWNLHLNNSLAQMIGILGVEYEDGTSEAITSNFINRPKIDLSFQTDTGKTVSRVYGSMRVKRTDNLPLYADSIAIKRLPFDSLEFVRFRSQKKYGYPVRITQEDRKRKAIADSIRRDSIRKANLKPAETIEETNKPKITPPPTRKGMEEFKQATPGPKAPDRKPEKIKRTDEK